MKAHHGVGFTRIFGQWHEPNAFSCSSNPGFDAVAMHQGRVKMPYNPEELEIFAPSIEYQTFANLVTIYKSITEAQRYVYILNRI